MVHLTRGNDVLHFYYDAQNRPAIVIFNGTAYGYLYNLQGDVVALVDGSGTKVVEYTYDAWGKPTGKTGTLASTLGTIQPFRYRGYVFDEETEQYYLRDRYYKQDWERFINADSILHENIYKYCNNNPLIYKDSSGHTAEEVIKLKMSLLKDYLDQSGSNKSIEQYWFAILVGDNVRLRNEPTLKDSQILATLKKNEIRAIYVLDPVWDETPFDPKNDLVKMWFPAIVFTGNKQPLEGFLPANYVLPKYGINKVGWRIRTGVDYYLRKGPNENEPYIVHKQGGSTVFVLITDPSHDITWCYCSTEDGDGWIKKYLIEPAY